MEEKIYTGTVTVRDGVVQDDYTLIAIDIYPKE